MEELAALLLEKEVVDREEFLKLIDGEGAGPGGSDLSGLKISLVQSAAAAEGAPFWAAADVALFSRRWERAWM